MDGHPGRHARARGVARRARAVVVVAIRRRVGRRRVPIAIGLTLVLGGRVVGTLKVGDADMVSIEAGRVRDGAVSFHRTLSADGSRMHFLAELIDDSLRVRFRHGAATDAQAADGSSQVVIFTATRVAGSP